jgi:hypothetical protein
MPSSVPTNATRWEPLDPAAVAQLLEGTTARWWLSGGVALDRWLDRAIRERANTDVSTTSADLGALVGSLPAGYSAWAPDGDDDVIPLAEASPDADLQPVRIHDDDADAWVLQVNVEDGTDRVWLYRRDPRLQLPWDRAVLDVGGIPTGAPEVQLVWKALRPRPQDDLDKDAVVTELSDEARAWYERAILSVHPHSSWSIHVRSPLTPAKASWNRKRG